VQMLSRVSAMFDVDLPVSVLVRVSTVEGLARAVHGESEPEDEVLPSALPALAYCDASVEVDSLHPAGVARAYGNDRRIHLLGSIENGPESLPNRIEDIADRALLDILEAQPSGPYHLAGFCHGGYVALEIARRLREAGEEVPLVILLHTWYAPATPLRFERSLIERLGRPAGLDESACRDLYLGIRYLFIKASALRHPSLLRHSLAASRRRYLTSPETRSSNNAETTSGTAGTMSAPGAVLALAMAAGRSHRPWFVRWWIGGYRPKPYTGRVVLVAGPDTGPLSDRLWRRVIPGMHSIRVPWSHKQSQTLPFAGKVGRVLRAIMDAPESTISDMLQRVQERLNESDQ
jgi:hypothetical protein